MSFFYDFNLDLEKALKYYIQYVKRHNGNISPEFENGLNIKILQGNSTLAQANSDVESNTIELRLENSIVTFFHELRHLSDQWVNEKNGKKYACWEYEKDFNSQMRWEDYNKKIVKVNRGVHGRYLGEAIAELYASKVYWEMCNNSQNAQKHTSKRTYYDEEVINLKKICVLFGIDEDQFINLSSKNDFGRNFMRKSCKQLTGQEKIWDILEDNLDFIEMKKVINTSHPTYIISSITQKAFKTNRENVKNIYNYILNASLENNTISKNEYANKVEEMMKLDQYIKNNQR